MPEMMQAGQRPFTLLVSLLLRSLRPGLLMFRSRTAGGRDHCRQVGGGIGAEGRGLAQTGAGRLGTSGMRAGVDARLMLS